MFFEGSEKKLEVVLSSTCADLRQRDWTPMVTNSGARILSKISSPSCDAYLLSESSLFVWDHRLTMITCGRTTLAHAAVKLFKEYGPDHVESFIFERKNESFPQHQKSDIFTDLELLNKHIPGKAYRFGDTNEHHLFLFHLNKHFHPTASDQTLEILMYEIQGEACDIFTEIPHQPGKVRELLSFSKELSGFKVDEHVFDPVGYSCNALRNDEYFTLHVTPQKISSYVSFETNMTLKTDEITKSVIQMFQPKSFDLVVFNPSVTITAFCDVSGYQVINNVRQKVNCGYNVGFASYYQPPSAPKDALCLNLDFIKEEL